MSEPWPKDRREELGNLIDMLVDLAGVNKGSGFIEKVSECISIANALHRSDRNLSKESFTQFLISEAVGDKEI